MTEDEHVERLKAKFGIAPRVPEPSRAAVPLAAFADEVALSAYLRGLAAAAAAVLAGGSAFGDWLAAEVDDVGRRQARLRDELFR